MNNQIIRYYIVGFISSSIHFFSASFFVFLNNSLIMSNLFGFSLAFGWSYYAQSKYVFDSKLSKIKGIKFLTVQITALFISVVFANFFSQLGIYFKIAIVVLLLPMCAFFINKFWTFAKDK